MKAACVVLLAALAAAGTLSGGVASATSGSRAGLITQTPSQDCPADTTIVDISGTWEFIPATVDVPAGTTVCWRNGDGWGHTVTSDTGAFDSGVIGIGQIYCFTFNANGSYAYHDELHPMTGTVNVHTGPPPPPPPSCAPPPPPPPPPGCPVGAKVVDILYYFNPETVYVAPGATVCWWNRLEWTREVVSDTGLFDSGDIESNSAFAFTFDKIGSYAYHEARVSWMVGRVNVAYPPPPWVSCPTGATHVDIGGYPWAFTPKTVDVAPGTTVCWTNQDGWTHTVTSDTGAFDSGVIRLGDTYSVTFNKTGSYAYHDELHPPTGTVIVNNGRRRPTGSFIVPRLIGLKVAIARARIRRSHGSVGRVRRMRSRRAGRVIAQKPASGKRLAIGARVSLVVGRR